MQTVIGVFEDRTQAERAVEQLVTGGIDRADVHIEGQAGDIQQAQPTSGVEHHKHHGIFAWLFGESDEDESQRNVYSEAVRRGSAVVVVDAQDESTVHRAVDCLHQAGAMDVDERAQQWRAEGWSDRPSRAAQDVTTDRPVGRDDGVLDVVQEELHVDKRQFDKGGVRVVQRVSEKPVREIVRLREEEAVVDRRPVDREATAGDTFKEGTLEVREMAEEPVVAKSARVVEEVRVGKQVREREQTVEDVVRRKYVEVQRLDGTRERAMASDNKDRDLSPRDPANPDDLPASDRPRRGV